jgi:hypothetical protein
MSRNRDKPQAGLQGFDSPLEYDIFLFSKMSRTLLEPTKCLIQWIQGALSQG